MLLMSSRWDATDCTSNSGLTNYCIWPMPFCSALESDMNACRLNYQKLFYPAHTTIGNITPINWRPQIRNWCFGAGNGSIFQRMCIPSRSTLVNMQTSVNRLPGDCDALLSCRLGLCYVCDSYGVLDAAESPKLKGPISFRLCNIMKVLPAS